MSKPHENSVIVLLRNFRAVIFENADYMEREGRLIIYEKEHKSKEYARISNWEGVWYGEYDPLVGNTISGA